ncbi:MAG: arsenic resistance N-acetyltransferase ArsN2 [Bacteroidota bacterium]
MSQALIRFVPVSDQEMPRFRQILLENQLPVDDLDDPHQWFFAYQDLQLIGTLGIESYDGIGLLRSLSIIPSQQGQGLGRRLVDAFLGEARDRGFAELFLLTTTAADFFAKQGFMKIDRSATPANIQRSQQFSNLCPSTATVMKLDLSEYQIARIRQSDRS